MIRKLIFLNGGFRFVFVSQCILLVAVPISVFPSLVYTRIDIVCTVQYILYDDGTKCNFVDTRPWFSCHMCACTSYKISASNLNTTYSSYVYLLRYFTINSNFPAVERIQQRQQQPCRINFHFSLLYSAGCTVRRVESTWSGTQLCLLNEWRNCMIYETHGLYTRSYSKL